MALKSTHFRFSESFLKDLDWLGKHSGGLDRTNMLRVLVAEAKARKAAELKAAKQQRSVNPQDGD
jgi:hypothetical protein